MKTLAGHPRWALFFLALASCAATPLGAQESPPGWSPRLFKPVFHPEKIYRFVSETQVYLAPPGEPPRLVLIKQQARYDVAPLVKGRALSLLGRTERLEVQIQSGAELLLYDSLNKETHASIIGQHLESAVNRHVELELDADMKILTRKEGGKGGSADARPGFPRFGPDELVQIIALVPQGFSSQPVDRGDEWVLKGRRHVGELGQLGFDVTYKLGGLTDHDRIPCVAIEFRGQLSGDIATANSRSVGFQGSQLTGRILFDPDLRMIRRSEADIQMTLHVPGKDKTERRPVTLQQKAILNLLSVK